MQVELLDRKKWNIRLELANAIFEYLEIWHNRKRRHSQLGWLTPIEFERGTFRSVRDLNAKIRAFITGWNDRCHPFTWTKTPEQILKKANRQTTSNTRH